MEEFFYVKGFCSLASFLSNHLDLEFILLILRNLSFLFLFFLLEKGALALPRRKNFKNFSMRNKQNIPQTQINNY